ncbi:hypothetical protein MUP35_03820 [Patescibacteria group bacterium]|nr:hypothetical protein [Patescibacteria group bacterium]
MVFEIDRGFRNLEKVANFVQKDEGKARRVRDKLREVKGFLGEEGLLIDNPRKQIKEAKDREWDRKQAQYQNHLAGLTEEALQVEGDNFKHSKIKDVVRALRNKITNGSDLRLNTEVKDTTLANQIWRAGLDSYFIFRRESQSYRDMPLTTLVTLKDFSKIVPVEGWRQTFEYVSQTFPKDTRVEDIFSVLRNFSRDKGKPVSERIKILHDKN